MSPKTANYVSVDVETAGPNPADYALLSIGACLVADPDVGFYVELRPTRRNLDPNTRDIHHLSMDHLAAHGRDPAQAMADFETWVLAHTPEDARPVFVALNAPFDWMFVNDYFHHFLGHNPFGHSAIDLKAVFMALHGIAWTDTRYAAIAAHYDLKPTLDHHALHDAQDQARLFQRMLKEIEEGQPSPKTPSRRP